MKNLFNLLTFAILVFGFKFYLFFTILETDTITFTKILVFQSVLQFFSNIFTTYTAEKYLAENRKLTKQIVSLEKVSIFVQAIIILISSIFFLGFLWFLLVIPLNYFWQIRFNKIIFIKLLNYSIFLEFAILSLSSLLLFLDLISLLIPIIIFFYSRQISLFFMILKRPSFKLQGFKSLNVTIGLLNWHHAFNIFLKNFSNLDASYIFLFNPSAVPLIKLANSVSSAISVFTGNLYLHYRHKLYQKFYSLEILLYGFSGFLATCIFLNNYLRKLILYFKGISPILTENIDFIQTIVILYLLHGVLFGGLRYTSLTFKDFTSSSFGILLSSLFMLAAPFFLNIEMLIYTPLIMLYIGSFTVMISLILKMRKNKKNEIY